MKYLNTILNGDVFQELKKIPDQSINCCVTSPPYYGLRDYGEDGQLGLEDTPEEYIKRMVEVFSIVKDKLKDDGTLWLNIGDSYAGGGGASGHTQSTKNLGAKTHDYGAVKSAGKTYGLKPKDLIGIPWMLAFALRVDGWYLRQDIIWHKPNPMPESVIDRCTKSHEYIFLLSKSRKYYYDNDAIKTPLTESTINRVSQDIENQNGSERVPGKTNGNMKAVVKGAVFGGNKGKNYTPMPGDPNFRNGSEQWGRKYQISDDGKANKKSVWTVTTKPFKEAHFATFPEKLIIPCIKAGSPEDGVVLDPFMGAGTTALVAKKLYRNYVGIELNAEYVEIANRRLYKELGAFA
jgi:DNA modification methylase